MQKRIIILGSTGSIGTQALDVAEMQGYKIVALTANCNVDLMERQIRKYMPDYVAMSDENAAKDLKVRVADTSVKVLSGSDGVIEIASIKCDTVINAIVGIAGLKPTVSALKSGNDIALANKETLVTAGELVLKTAKENNVKILPVDSEHSAIFQSIQGVPQGSISKILLTASGGPFFGKSKNELELVTLEMALAHPTWSMGQKITIDSATMMNKGLEVIEAMHLFKVPADKIEILIHRESILHSAVELCDGAVIGQLGAPDMRIPIQYALTYPDRLPSPSKRLSLTDVGKLTFYKPDIAAFECLSACLNAAKCGGLKPCAVNGANEVAVSLFINGKIGFTDIGRLVTLAGENQKHIDKYSLDDVFAADNEARDFVYSNYQK